MYLWIKALHVVAVISWMAGLLYLPRLFVYHTEAERGSVQSETFKVMERRLLKAIMTPAMIVTWISGLTLAIQSGFYDASWFRMKAGLVVLLSVIHVYLGRLVQGFQNDANRHDQKFYRVLNEAPTLLMILIVGLVIIKP
jgi:protoporphyrinogen IX oxidase